MTPQINCLRKMRPVQRVSTHIYCVSKETDWKTFIRSFICNTKRPSVKQSIKLISAQIFRFTPGGVKLMDPPFETARAQSELFIVQGHQSEPIQNIQLIRKYKEIPVHIYTYRYQRQRPIPNLRCSTQIGCY